MKKPCQYTRTYTGACEQSAFGESAYCYYHSKVADGLIETTDPILSMRRKDS